MFFGVTMGRSAANDSISSILREPVVLVVMLLETPSSAAGTPPSTILIGILFRTGAARAGLFDDERVGVGVSATSGDPSSLFGEVTVVVAAAFPCGGIAVTDLARSGLTMGSEGGFHIGPLGRTAYWMHKSQFVFIFTRPYLFLSFNLRDPSVDAIQFPPRLRIIGLDRDHF